MNYTIIAYSIYLPVAIMLTVWVANKLLSNAKVFYVDIFQGQNDQALSLNKLIQVGFYLMGLGFAFLRLKISSNLQTYYIKHDELMQAIIETLSYKIGSFVVILGVMLLLNLILILAQRKNKSKPIPPLPTNTRVV